MPLELSTVKVCRKKIKRVGTIFCLIHLSITSLQANAGDIKNPVLVPEKPIAAPVDNINATKSSGEIEPPLAPPISKK